MLVMYSIIVIMVLVLDSDSVVSLFEVHTKFRSAIQISLCVTSNIKVF